MKDPSMDGTHSLDSSMAAHPGQKLRNARWIMDKRFMRPLPKIAIIPELLFDHIKQAQQGHIQVSVLTIDTSDGFNGFTQ